MVPVLMYHRVSVEPPERPSPFVVERDRFVRQLRVLRALGYTTPPVADVLAGRAPHRSVLITFDDGYVDNLTVALPLLIEHGFRALAFVLADLRRKRNWWDAFRPMRAEPLVTPAQVRELKKHGVEIGSHGITHRDLATLSGAEVRRELAESKARLEDTIGEAVTTFAYPYGVVSPELKEHVRAAGYDAAFAVNSGPVRAHVDPYEIRRVLVGNRAAAAYVAAKLGPEQLARRAIARTARGAHIDVGSASKRAASSVVRALVTHVERRRARASNA